MTLTHSYRNGKEKPKHYREVYKKSDRWTIYARRPRRHVYYLGIDKFIPMIESETQRTIIKYETTTLSDDLTDTIKKKASDIFNKQYTAYNKHKSRKGKTYIGVESNGTRYSSLSMSAGEQKVFLLLETIFKVDKYSFCFNETKPDAIHRLTGKQEKTIEIFVEDDLATAILNKIVSSLKIKKYVSIKKFGAASNCFTTIGGLLISNENIDKTLFVLDGDVFITNEHKQKQLKKAITGHGDTITFLRNKALQHIKQLKLPENTQPEKYLHELLININNLDNEDEIIEVAKEISCEQDSHNYLSRIIERLDYGKSVGYTKIIDLVSTYCQDKWQSYISEVYIWLEEKVPEVRESD